jgi:putative colanic acid biosynthesis glycosyltransferase
LPFLRWSSGKDEGIYDAMNKGTSRTQGRYVCYLNAGDVFAHATALAEMRTALERANWPQLCYAGANWLFPDGSTRYRAPRRIESAIRHGLPAIHQATLYERAFLEMPPYDVRYSVSADYYISVVCFLKNARACYLNTPTVNFEVGGTSMRRAYTSLLDVWNIQRDVLHEGLFVRSLSAARRFIAHRILAGLHLLKRA